MSAMRIYLDVKFNSYSIFGEIISIALVDSSTMENTLYIENSSYDTSHNGAWPEAALAANNRILYNGNRTFSSNIDASYIPINQIRDKIALWLSQYPKVEIYTKDPMSWLLFVSIFGTIDDLPNAVDIAPIFLPSYFKFKGYVASTDMHTFVKVSTELAPLKHNALFDVVKIKECFRKLELK